MSDKVDYNRVEVWTRYKYDQQVYMFFDGPILVGLNFHHGIGTIDEKFLEPDPTIFNTFAWIRQHRIDNKQKAINRKKMIKKAIRIWLMYVIPYYN